MKESFNKKYYPVFLASIAVPVFTWFLVMVFSDVPLSLFSLFKIHLGNPVLFICDLLPVFVYYIIRSFRIFHEKEADRLHSVIDTLHGNISQNLEFAKKIGNGEYDAEIRISPDDHLGASLKMMQDNLRSTNDKETKQLWIAEGKEQVSGLLREMKDIESLSYGILVDLIRYTGLIQGAFYFYDEERKLLVNKATYAYNRRKYIDQEFKIGKGLIGQAAFEMAPVYKKDLPPGFATITSGLLGDRNPACIYIVPLIANEKLQGAIELASLKDDIPLHVRDYIVEISEIVARTIFNLKINLRTEILLQEARTMTEELRENEVTLNRNAEEMKANQEKIEETNQHLEMQVKLVENAKQRLYSLLENASEVISIYNPDGTVLYESPSARNILGYGPEEIVGTDGFARIHNTQSDVVQRAFVRLLTKPDEMQIIEFQYTKRNGENVWLESVGRNLLNNPAINGIIFNTRDISARKLAEKEQRKRGQMQALSENSPDIIIRLNLDGIFYYVNPVIEKYTFIPPAKFFQKYVHDIGIDDDFKDMLRDLLETVKTKKCKLNKEYEIESLFENKVMSVNAIPEYNDEKELETVLIVAHDITDQKKIEQEIREINKNITESINYAKRIQTSIIPAIEVIREHLGQSFVLYKPKDIISGDFPWFFTNGENIYIAAVDCTGHGVPGALLSFVGYFLLNNIVDHTNGHNTADILDILNSGVQKTLRQDADKPGSHDGMDIALCKINRDKNLLQFSGAHRPLYLLRNNEITEYKGDRKPIGGAYVNKKSLAKFTLHEIQIEKGDRIFFFTDGLPDQYGGPQHKKYTTLKIKEGIITNPDFSISKFSDYFATEFVKWKGELKQIDDVLMIGIEF